MATNIRFAEVVVSVSHSQVDRTFDYIIPQRLAALITPGVEVAVPFGNRTCSGYVMALKATSDVAITKLKEIKAVWHEGEAILTEELLALAQHMAKYYLVPLYQALICMVPGGLSGKERSVSPHSEQWLTLSKEYTVEEIMEHLKRAPRQRELVKLLQDKGKLAKRALPGLGFTSYSSLNALIAKGYVQMEKQVARKTQFWSSKEQATRPSLTNQQKIVVNFIQQALRNKRSKPILLYGVTGSGKTEVYLRSLEACLRSGKQGILLVPEITLTPQMTQQLVARFQDKVAVMHSALSKSERYAEWQRVKLGQAKVVVGARSAIFAPCPQLGLIIIDEEHETTYKQSDGVRYDVHHLAHWRVRRQQATLLFGSATPSVESYYYATSGKYDLLQLPDRINARPLPKIEIVDMRAEFKSGHKAIFSRRLQNALRECILIRGEKAILFLNRRGYASFLSCHSCGHVIQCEDCDVSMTYHISSNRLVCHYCGRTRAVPRYCPVCGHEDIEYFGLGTEHLVEAVQNCLPGAAVIRVDSDTTRIKDAHQKLLRQFTQTPRSILVGTQMIAKGLDIPDVTLVGVVSADVMLNLPDFRAEERTFQLLTQVAGRAGRADKVGEVIIQSFMPQHYSVQAAKAHDYAGFFAQEIAFRQERQYPPFSKLINITCSHSEERVARRAVFFLKEQLLQQQAPCTYLGPAPAPIGRIKKRYRWHLVLSVASQAQVRAYIKDTVAKLRYLSQKLKEPVRIAVDVDPKSIL